MKKNFPFFFFIFHSFVSFLPMLYHNLKYWFSLSRTYLFYYSCRTLFIYLGAEKIKVLLGTPLVYCLVLSYLQSPIFKMIEKCMNKAYCFLWVNCHFYNILVNISSFFCWSQYARGVPICFFLVFGLWVAADLPYIATWKHMLVIKLQLLGLGTICPNRAKHVYFNFGSLLSIKAIYML